MIKGHGPGPRACGHTTATQQDRASRSGYPRERATCKSRPCGQRAGRHRACRRWFGRGNGTSVAAPAWLPIGGVQATGGGPDLSAGYFNRPEYAIRRREDHQRAPHTRHHTPDTRSPTPHTRRRGRGRADRAPTRTARTNHRIVEVRLAHSVRISTILANTRPALEPQPPARRAPGPTLTTMSLAATWWPSPQRTSARTDSPQSRCRSSTGGPAGSVA
jgi:hypothetical protein